MEAEEEKIKAQMMMQFKHDMNQIHQTVTSQAMLYNAIASKFR